MTKPIDYNTLTHKGMVTFTSGQKHAPYRAFAFTLWAVQQLVDNGNWDRMVDYMSRCQWKSATKNVMEALFDNVTVVKTKAHQSGYIVVIDGPAPIASNRSAAIHEAYEKLYGINSKEVRAALGTPEPEFNLEKYAKTVFNRLSKQKVSIRQMIETLAKVQDEVTE